jgi:hypothetical protein
MSGDFNPEQKRYLEGFVAGLQIAKAARANDGVPSAQGTATAEPTGPDAPHLRAQDRVLKAGGKLSEQEKFKRELHPFDGYDRLKAQAANNEYPKPPDNFRWRYFRPVLRGAEPELLYVPVADAERYPHTRAVCRDRRPRRALWRRLFPCHHPRQPAGARDRGP